MTGFACVYLLSIVCDWGQDGAQRLKAHRNVQQMGSKEEVVVVAQDGHGHVPGQVEEGLQEGREETQIILSCCKLELNWQWQTELIFSWLKAYLKKKKKKKFVAI